mmetsp:Transcript_29865/g.41311  ORF Transcript_29865/g.41311 Transcript_29865/m.41311 type:complete len:932 (-) Transcript_29865:169-2964(-)|eukprot:CAMPEP_0196586098 /NCGR_PEP_ID=MMETSP1081-20130531/53099_1 /TAXON_ID=36882 /ORGANISM="Pyramimonas amylifera, Strain CCMP720" /LENGTH=931 /DNA_ID=CAMNT_0041907857 /DNA_START=367 /DNA_END=3162 /DNA_ORIENTATION=-
MNQGYSGLSCSNRASIDGEISALQSRPFNTTCSFAFEPLERWSKFHVADSLRALGQYAVGGQTADTQSFEEYAETFLTNNVDGISLVNLTCTKLKHDLQVGNMDHRRKIFDWIEHLMVASGSDEPELPGSSLMQQPISHNSIFSVEVEAQALQRLRLTHWRQLGSLAQQTQRAREDLRALKEEVREALQMNSSSVVDTVKALSEQLGAALTERNQMNILNRDLYNQVQDLRGAIRVICRVRPLLASDEDVESGEVSVSIPNSNSILVNHNGYKGGVQVSQGDTQQVCKLFKFDAVYGPQSSQEEVFLSTEPLVRSVLDGFNVCIFAYGQTGSGKTHTMMGGSSSSDLSSDSLSSPSSASPSSSPAAGINVRALDLLFQMRDLRQKAGHGEYHIGMEMREIYNDVVRDLLVDHTVLEKGWGVKADPRKVGDKETTRVVRVDSTIEVMHTIRCGERARSVGATALNEQSSRSHCIVTVFAEGMLTATNTRLEGRLQLVDLAGSERVLRSEALGERLKEAQHINRSLSALGDVVAALQEKRSHVPFRNSVLTRHLQESLSGCSKVLMFAHVNPSPMSAQETLSTLNFAQRVASVELGKARANVQSQELLEAREEMPRMREELERSVRSLAQRDDDCARLEGKLKRLEESASRQNLSREQSSMELCSRLQKDVREADAARARAVYERDEAWEHSYTLQQTITNLNLDVFPRSASSASALTSGISTPAPLLTSRSSVLSARSSGMSTPQVKSAFSSTGSSPRDLYMQPYMPDLDHHINDRQSISASVKSPNAGARTTFTGVGISRARSGSRSNTGSGAPGGGSAVRDRGRAGARTDSSDAAARKRRSASASTTKNRTSVLTEIQEMPAGRVRGSNNATGGGYASDGGSTHSLSRNMGGRTSGNSLHFNPSQNVPGRRGSIDKDTYASRPSSGKRWM